MRLGRIENRLSRYIVVSHNFPLGVVEMFHWVTNLERL